MMRTFLVAITALYLGAVAFNADPENFRSDDDPLQFAVSVVSDTNAHLIGNAYVVTGHQYPIACDAETWMAAIRLTVGGTDTDCPS